MYVVILYVVAKFKSVVVLSSLKSYDCFMLELREVIPFSGEVEAIINAGRIGSEPLVTACLGARSLDWFFSSCCIQNKSATVLKSRYNIRI